MVESSIGSLGNNDNDGCKNVQVQLRSFKLYRAYSISFSSLNVGNFFVNWILKDCIEDQEKKKESRCLMFTPSIKRKIRHVYVVVVLWRQRNAQESVMHVQSCCLANLNLLLFCHSCWRRRCRCLSFLIIIMKPTFEVLSERIKLFGCTVKCVDGYCWSEWTSTRKS